LRITTEQSSFLKQAINRILPDAAIFLFGSRVHDHLKGGDIDVLVIADNKLTGQQKRDLKIAFYKRFGEQKIDIVCFDEADDSAFKNLALDEAVRL
jgi:uncharacterized protein